MGNSTSLSKFHKKKLLIEFDLFYDVNKDGQLSWEDFNLAKQQICEICGWRIGSESYTNAHELLVDVWRELQNVADEDTDGRVSKKEWIKMWKSIVATRRKNKKKNKDGEAPDNPMWVDDYIHYKFNLLNKSGSETIILDDFVEVLHRFNVPRENSTAAYKLMTKDNSKPLDYTYFHDLAVQYYMSSKRKDLATYINGTMEWGGKGKKANNKKDTADSEKSKQKEREKSDEKKVKKNEYV